MDVIYPVCAAMDVHRDTVVVTIRKLDERGRERLQTRTFETFHDSLLAMNEWLDEHEVPVVGLESTGVYWKPIVRVIREQSPQRVLWLVNPAMVKQVPGRKTDVNDSQWLSKLVMYGLVAPSFLPTAEFDELRELTRYRAKLVAAKTSLKNQILKALEASGIKLATVCTDPFGTTGRNVLAALLEGGRSVEQIANLAKGSLRKKIPEIRRAVEGALTEATRLVLQSLLRQLLMVEADIAQFDEKIQQRLEPYQKELELLLSVPGLDRVASAAILAEIGPDMSRFPSADHLAAWAGVCPGSNESAGKSKNTPTRKGDKYLRTMLVQAAWPAVRTRGTFWKQKFGQLVVRLGPKKAIVAIARKMLVAIHFILRDGVLYKAPAPPPPSPAKVQRLVNNYSQKLEALGYQVTLAPVAAQVA